MRGMAKQPINPQILSWSMETSGFDVSVVADAVKRTTEEVEAWLAGEAPNRGDVERLAKLFGRSKYFFNLPTPPRGDEVPASFRYLSDNAGEHPTELAALRWARILQAQMEILLRNEDVESPPNYSQEGSPESAAVKARAWLVWATTSRGKGPERCRSTSHCGGSARRASSSDRVIGELRKLSGAAGR